MPKVGTCCKKAMCYCIVSVFCDSKVIWVSCIVSMYITVQMLVSVVKCQNVRSFLYKPIHSTNPFDGCIYVIFLYFHRGGFKLYRAISPLYLTIG